jgi:polar amino acid transport system substrate-binding protein
VLQAESYGIAFPNDSPVVELVNQALLELREDGTYDRLRDDYFGG